MNIYTESITKFIRTYPYLGLEIRCWRQEEEVYNYTLGKNTRDEILEKLEKLHDKEVTEISTIALRLLEMERMNAVEVIEPYGDKGVVLYKDWP